MALNLVSSAAQRVWEYRFPEAYQMIDDKIDISASAYIIGSELLSAATFTKSMIGNDVKQLDELKLEKVLVSTMDFSEIAGIPLVLKTMFTDSGIIMTTGEAVDIVELSKIDDMASQDLLNINFTYKISLSDAQFQMDLLQDIRINAVEDGIQMLSITKF